MEQENPRFSNPRAIEGAFLDGRFVARASNADGNAPTSPPMKRNSTHGIKNRQVGAASLRKSDLVSGFSSSDGPADGNGNRRIEVSTLQRSNLVPGFSSASDLVQDHRNFGKSGAPSRILVFRAGSWTDVPREVFDVLRAGFVAGKTTLEVPVEGSSYVFDFLRMSRVDMGTGALNSIGWIDIDSRCFFPRMALDHEPRNMPPKLETGGDSSFDSPEEHSDESPEAAVTTDVGGRPRWAGTELLKEEDKHYKVVERVFVAGVQRFGLDAVVTSVHKCSHSGPIGSSRLKAFQMQIQMTRAARGDGNVKFGWYGAASAECVTSVVAHGFGRPNNGLVGPSNAFGVGVHLSPPHSPYASSLLTEADGNGERHVILCRVVMGKSEEVPAGSLRFHPSTDEFDSGVDDLANPKWYVVWSTHMNTHILPEYVVSYRTGKQRQGCWRVMTQAKRPSITSLSFPKLFAEMGTYLQSSRMQAVEIFYNQYKAGKISKETFIRCLRSIAGDKIITSTIRRVRGY